MTIAAITGTYVLHEHMFSCQLRLRSCSASSGWPPNPAQPAGVPPCSASSDRAVGAGLEQQGSNCPASARLSRQVERGHALAVVGPAEAAAAVRIGAELEEPPHRLDPDPYRGTALTWVVVRVEAVRRLLELGADPDARGSFGGPDHGEGVTALHLAAQAGRGGTVEVLLEAGADGSITDALHGGTPAGWAGFGGHPGLAEQLQSRS